ncbi:MAG: hypothetical protein PWQ71_1291, partial [Bacteroidota bacterium]|nr:hypothetical protein [Bacteroidota bacterium]
MKSTPTTSFNFLLADFRFNAKSKRFACSGVRMMRDFTFAFGTPGTTRIKS